ncbi:MAG: 2-amino-4-hydroxy-6-hydroxymethyldihydropteridine diphosphokinase [Spirochaetota bacterium]|nr:2-amino-4-hydroxy-6-hydroxymethyldihydropteridine diphosphokinase [Spirochaetota bacterium]
MALVYIGLGSNVGNRSLNLENSIYELIQYSSIKLIRMSSVEETRPVDFLDQPMFLNQVIGIETDIEPFELLEILKGIELKLGRTKTLPKGPRIIDMDILLYDDVILKTEVLKIPHPQIKSRGFIMKHLLELDSNIVDPVTKISYRDCYTDIRDRS